MKKSYILFILCFSSLLMQAQVIQSDSLALMALYNSTNGDNWTNNTNWDTTSVSDWYGVTVMGNRVTILYLPDNQLSGSIPSELGDLTAITDLNLKENQLSGSIPSELGNLTALTLLELNANQLSGSIPSELGNLTALTLLYLHNNQLSGTIPSDHGNLTSLQYLILYNNQLSGSIPSEFGNLTSLLYLYLHNNQLSGDLPNLLALVNLAVLSINDNYFTFNATEAGLAYSSISIYPYSPQYDFPLNANKVIAPTGSNLDIDITSLSVNNLGGANNLYEWFKDGISIDSPSASSVLSFTGIVADDYDSYTCQVTNTEATALTLTSDTIFLVETNTDPIVENPIADIIMDAGFGSITIDLSNVFSDPDGDPLSYFPVSGNTGVVTVGVVDDTLTISEVAPGTTEITVTADDGYGGTVDDVFSLTINALINSIQELTDFDLKIYPNPSTGIFTIENSNPNQKLSVRIVDINGKTILQKELNQQNTLIDISKNGKGLYFVVFEGRGRTVTGRIVVK